MYETHYHRAGSVDEAAKLMGEAAAQNLDAAEVEYAIMIFRGEGVKQDEALAASWLERAARGGNAVAQSRLAKLYAAGRGVKLDSVSAAFWYLMARQRGLTDPSLEALVSSLTDEERKQVSERASTWQTGFVR